MVENHMGPLKSTRELLLYGKYSKELVNLRGKFSIQQNVTKAFQKEHEKRMTSSKVCTPLSALPNDIL